MSIAITAAAGSEIGNRYRENYDVQHLSLDPLLAIVADGMGDGPGSAMAGRTTVDTLVDRLRAEKPDATGILDAVATASRLVVERGKEIAGLSGCTLTALIEGTDGFWITQLGDSRVYRLRAGVLELLTVDHTMAWLGAVHGWYPFDSEQAATARYHLIRCVGDRTIPDPDLMRIAPRPGDVFLLCTDGVTEQVSFYQIRETLMGQATPAVMVESLLAAANAAGGNDNASAIVIAVGEGDPS